MYHGTTDCRSSQLGILPAYQCFCVAVIGHLEEQGTLEKRKGKREEKKGALGMNMALLKYSLHSFFIIIIDFFNYVSLFILFNFLKNQYIFYYNFFVTI
jgi:hypothetical protein